MTERKGIVLAGGSGTRLHPITLGLSKQLLPVYDKPMIYYPLSVLFLAGIREVAIITTPHDQAQFQYLLGDGAQWGANFTWIVQEQPEGLAQAYTLADDFLDGAPSAMVLGDNIFFGHGLSEALRDAAHADAGATVFGYHVADPRAYGVVGFDENDNVTALVEKPANPPSSYAVTGLYFLDGSAPERARGLTPSARGELEITALLETYLDEQRLELKRLGRGYAWLDTGTYGGLLDAANFVRTLQLRQSTQVCCPEEIAHANGWIDDDQLRALAERYGKTDYGRYLAGLVA